MEKFCASCSLKSLIKEPTCFKSVDNPSCIDLILTNHPKCFQNSGVYETGIFNFHKLTFTVHIFRRPNRELSNREITNTLITFRDELIRELFSNNMQPDDLARFTNISKMILEKKAPLKERYVRYNQAKLMNKKLAKSNYESFQAVK